MRTCYICYQIINDLDCVELSLEINPTRIIGRYQWQPCNYCFTCIEQCKTTLWNIYKNIITTPECNKIFEDLILLPIPIRLTHNMALFGKPIYALFYHGQMHSSKLNYNLTDFEFYHFQKHINSLADNIRNQRKIHEKQKNNIITLNNMLDNLIL